MTKSTRISLAVIAALVLALVGGYFGAGLRGDSSATSATSGTWMETIKDRGELRVGVGISPPMTVEENGKLGGPNIIPLENLADSLGVKLTPVSATYANIVAGLQADRYDVAANLDSTLKRAIAIQFSGPVFEYQAVFVVKANSPHRTSADVLESGQPIAIVQGSAEGDVVKDAGANVLELPDYTNAFQAVEAGRAVAELTEVSTAGTQVTENKDYKVIVPDPMIYTATSNYGLPADIDARSVELINIAIRTANLSGEMERAYRAVGYRTIDQLGDLEKK